MKKKKKKEEEEEEFAGWLAGVVWLLPVWKANDGRAGFIIACARAWRPPRPSLSLARERESSYL
jgi:hypothetical protein